MCYLIVIVFNNIENIRLGHTIRLILTNCSWYTFILHMLKPEYKRLIYEMQKPIIINGKRCNQHKRRTGQ
jgi:hypothetical protein